MWNRSRPHGGPPVIRRARAARTIRPAVVSDKTRERVYSKWNRSKTTLPSPGAINHGAT
jgi:hypothetical protein